MARGGRIKPIGMMHAYTFLIGHNDAPLHMYRYQSDGFINWGFKIISLLVQRFQQMYRPKHSNYKSGMMNYVSWYPCPPSWTIPITFFPGVKKILILYKMSV